MLIFPRLYNLHDSALVYLHELKQQTGLDGNGEVICSRVFSRNGWKEGVPDGTGPFQHLFHPGPQPPGRTLDPATPEQGLRFCRQGQLQQRLFTLAHISWQGGNCAGGWIPSCPGEWTYTSSARCGKTGAMDLVTPSRIFCKTVWHDRLPSESSGSQYNLIPKETERSWEHDRWRISCYHGNQIL